MSKPKIKKRVVKQALRTTTGKGKRFAKPPVKFERMYYQVKPGDPKLGGKYLCACGCKKKVKKLFAKGHVSRFVKIMTDESFDKAVSILREVRNRVKPVEKQPKPKPFRPHNRKK